MKRQQLHTYASVAGGPLRWEGSGREDGRRLTITARDRSPRNLKELSDPPRHKNAFSAATPTNHVQPPSASRSPCPRW